MKKRNQINNYKVLVENLSKFGEILIREQSYFFTDKSNNVKENLKNVLSLMKKILIEIA